MVHIDPELRREDIYGTFPCLSTDNFERRLDNPAAVCVLLPLTMSASATPTSLVSSKQLALTAHVHTPLTCQQSNSRKDARRLSFPAGRRCSRWSPFSFLEGCSGSPILTCPEIHTSQLTNSSQKEDHPLKTINDMTLDEYGFVIIGEDNIVRSYAGV
jgi:hypothetical protein